MISSHNQYKSKNILKLHFAMFYFSTDLRQQEHIVKHFLPFTSKSLVMRFLFIQLKLFTKFSDFTD